VTSDLCSLLSYEYYTQDESTLVELDVREIKKGLHITDRRNRIHRQKLLFKILQSAGLTDDDRSNIPDHEIYMVTDTDPHPFSIVN
jgi:hypothetical protein